MLSLLVVAGLLQTTVRVSDYYGLRQALAHAQPGTTVLLAPGDYAGGFEIKDIRGTAGKPIVVAGADPKNPPHIVRGGLHFVRVAYLELRDLWVIGPTGNGINVDDGGIREKPAHHVTFNRIKSTDCSDPGSCGLKMAGVDDFTIVDCDVQNYGVCGVDLVGCHRGTIESTHFEKGLGVGVQAKGASSDVKVLDCQFKDYGGRGVNIGGSTGAPYFRPPLETKPTGQRYEAKNITVEGCTFEGGDAAIAYVGVDGATVRYNTIYLPQKWAIRILQESAGPEFLPSRNGTFEKNIVVFNSAHWFEGGVNIGPGTEPKSFRFANNLWYCLDKPERSQPTLPTPETNPQIAQDPLFKDPAKGDFTLQPKSPAVKIGAKRNT